MVPEVNNSRTYIFIGLILKKKLKERRIREKRYQSNFKNLNLNLILTLN